MDLRITDKEKLILIDLLESRARELHPTIRRSRVSSVTDELKHDLEEIEELLVKVRSSVEVELRTGN